MFVGPSAFGAGVNPAITAVPPGEDQTGLISSILALGRVPYLLPGIHGLGIAGGAPDPIIMPDDGVVLGAGDGVTFVEPRWSRLAADADNPNNDVFEIVGTKDLVKLSTTMAADAMTNTRKLTLTALGTLAAGDWIAIEGPRATDENGVTPNPALSFSQLLRVSPTWGGANPVVPEGATIQYASAAAPAQTVQAVNPRTGVTLAGFTIRAAAANNIAVGIRCSYAVSFKLFDLGFEGMSRRGIETELGSRDFNIWNIRIGPECNGLIGLESVAQFSVFNMWSEGHGDFVHPQGIPRHPIVTRLRTSNGIVAQGRFAHGLGGVRSWGGRELHFRDIVANDWVLEPMRVRDVTLGATGCFDCGSGNFAAFGEFQHACSWQGCYANAGETFANDPNVVGANYAWWLNDTQDSDFDGCGVVSYGRTPSTAYIGSTYPLIGMLLDDAWDNRLRAIVIEGVNYGFITIGGCQSDVADLYFDGSCAGTQPTIAIYLNNTNLDGSPRFGKVTFANWGTKVWFGANFVATPDYNLEIKEYVNRQSAFSVAAGLVVEGRFTDVVLANNPGAGVLEFDLVNLDPASPAGVRNILPGGAASQYSSVVVNAGPSNAGVGLILVCPLPAAEAWVNITAPILGIAVGDLLEGVGAAGVVNNASVFPNCIGKSRDATAAGAVVRCVRVGKA